MPVYRSGPCPACGENRAAILGTPDLSKDPVGAPKESRLLGCRSCGHLRVDPMPSWSSEDFQLLYGEGYFVPDSPRWGRIRETVNPRSRHRRIQGILRTEGRRLLEVGSGIYAHFCTVMSGEGWDVLAQEPSPEFQKVLRGKGLAVVGEGFLELPEDAKFSLIFADSVFEHVSDPLAYFQKAGRLLEPGGVLYLVVPRERSLFGNIKQILSKLRGAPSPLLTAYRPPYHLHGYTARSVARFAQAAGLELPLVY
ncbi:MAG TPA: class I SAM-dependent methyltransferase, partial [Fibrobacteria bacterium]|nr:class I SAM-dependent methyltransferase [Fibrobacteria bacterium]